MIYGLFPYAVEDILINLGLVAAHDQLILSNSILHGQTFAIRTDITFIGLAKDSESSLPGNLKLLEQLANSFKSSQALIIYGASTDGTGNILDNWAEQSNHNRTVFNLTVPTFGKFLREQKLAYIRNFALEYMFSKMPPTTYIMWVDLDILGWDNIGVLDTFQRRDWDVMCGHGIVWHGIYRDVYALRVKGLIEHTNHNFWNVHSVHYNITAREARQYQIVYEVLSYGLAIIHLHGCDCRRKRSRMRAICLMLYTIKLTILFKLIAALEGWQYTGKTSGYSVHCVA